MAQLERTGLRIGESLVQVTPETLCYVFEQVTFSYQYDYEKLLTEM